MQSKALIDDPDHYIKSFGAFSVSFEKLDLYTNWVGNVFSKAVLVKFVATLKEGAELRILGVGSGSGEMDCMMIKILLQHYPRINNRVVEPLQNMMDLYKALAQSKSSELQGVTFDWRQQTIQQHQTAGDATTFHFISVVHSIYHVNDVNNTLMYLYNRLEPGGVLLVILNSTESNGIWRFRNQVPYATDQGYYLGSAEFLSLLDKLNIPYTHHPQPVHNLEITNCFDETSEEGNLLLDFLTQTVKFRETAPDDVKRRAMEYLTTSQCSEKIGEKIFISHQSDAVVITKPVS